jgi:hypothetical protein
MRTSTVADSWAIDAEASAQTYGWKGRTTLIPDGPCPVKLESFDPTVVAEWAEKVIHSGHLKHQTHYGPSALRYFVQKFFVDINTKEGRQDYKIVSEIINSLTPSCNLPEEVYEQPRRPDYSASYSPRTETRPEPTFEKGSPIVVKDDDPTLDDDMMEFAPAPERVPLKKQV